MKEYKPLFVEGVENLLLRIPSRKDKTLQDYRNETEIILTDKEKIDRIVKFINRQKLSVSDKKVFDKILSDPEIIKKLRFVIDNSYRTHCIYYRPGLFKFSNFYIRACPISETEPDISHSDKIDFIKNNYETIFIFLEDKDISIDEIKIIKSGSSPITSILLRNKQSRKMIKTID